MAQATLRRIAGRRRVREYRSVSWNWSPSSSGPDSFRQRSAARKDAYLSMRGPALRVFSADGKHGEIIPLQTIHAERRGWLGRKPNPLSRSFDPVGNSTEARFKTNLLTNQRHPA